MQQGKRSIVVSCTSLLAMSDRALAKIGPVHLPWSGTLQGTLVAHQKHCLWNELWCICNVRQKKQPDGSEPRMLTVIGPWDYVMQAYDAAIYEIQD